jgi:hypothetical protein
MPAAMSGTLLRLGLWIVLIVLALYVLRETYDDSPIQEYLTASVLQRAGAVGLALIAVGAVLEMLGTAAHKVKRSHCATCRRPIPPGEIYCREHLRRVLEVEHDRTHSTRIRGR